MVSLPAWVKENGEIVNALREYVRTRKQWPYRALKIIEALKRYGIPFKIVEQHNIVVTVGRNVVARRLSGNTTYTGEITDGALGNAVSPSFTNVSTQLGSEVGRKASSDASYDSNITYIDFFFASGDIADGTYTEWGTFIDGDGSTPNDGVAFSLLATGGWVKSGSIYISSQYTIT